MQDAMEPPIDEDELLRPQDAAALLGLNVQTLEKWRVRGCGPQFERLTPKVIRYSRRALREWRARCAHRSTAEYSRELDHAQ
jgi:predicted DNA-binding transcriptional regulator AlpA